MWPWIKWALQLMAAGVLGYFVCALLSMAACSDCRDIMRYRERIREGKDNG